MGIVFGCAICVSFRLWVGRQYGDWNSGVDGWSVTSGTARTGLGGVVKVL